ncbi:MAG: class I SAM-dependent methyltransferase [Burkholderiaceae bacterium]
MTDAHTPRREARPLPWVERWLQGCQPGQQMLDLACGSGRHVQAGLALGLRVLAVDRNAQALARLPRGTETLCADLEGQAWPFMDRRFDVIVVTHYLFRPRLALLAGLLAPGGRLIYSTFAHGNARFGKPSNPDYLLAEGELWARARLAGLSVIAYEHGLDPGESPAIVQRLCAVRPIAGQEWPGQLELAFF